MNFIIKRCNIWIYFLVWCGSDIMEPSLVSSCTSFMQMFMYKTFFHFHLCTCHFPDKLNFTNAFVIYKDQILMQMHISFLQPKSMLIWIYVWINFLNFRHGLMVHMRINAYFACFWISVIFSKISICAAYFLFKMFITIYNF
jgi:hypothetical protein